MLKVNCINCGRHYKVKDDLKDKALKCPHCGMPIRIDAGEEKEEVSEEAVRAELLRLAGSGAAEQVAKGTASKGKDGEGTAAPRRREKTRSSGPARPKKKASAKPSRKSEKTGKKREPAEGQKAQKSREDSDTGGSRGSGRATRVEETRADYTGLIIGLVVLLVLGLGGVYGFSRYQAYQKQQRNDRTEARSRVKTALQRAREVDDPCGGREARQAWLDVRQKAQAYEQRYGGGDFVDVISRAGERIQALKSAREQREETFSQMQELVDRAERQIENENYTDAKNLLTRADGLAENQKCENEKLRSLRGRISELLQSDPVRYGSKGWVLYKGEWMPRNTAQARKKEARIAEMKAKGLVLYEGEWIKPDEKEARIGRKRRERERARMLAARQREVQEKMAHGAEKVTLDTCEGPLRWSGENWSNPVQLSIEKIGDPPDSFLTIVCEEGPKDKWVSSISQRCDITEFEEFEFDIQAPHRLRLALGVWTLPDYKLHESRPISVGEGLNENVSVNLQNERYKSKKTKWQHRTGIENADKVYKFSLFFYSQPRGPVRVKDVFLVRKKGGGTGD